MSKLGQVIRSLRNEPRFSLLPRPRRFPEKRKTGLDTRIVKKAADRNAPPHLGPTMPLHQAGDDERQGDAVQRIAGMTGGRWHLGGNYRRADRTSKRQRPRQFQYSPSVELEYHFEGPN